MGLEDGTLTSKNTKDLPSQTAAQLTGPTSEPPMDIIRCAPMSLLQLYIPAEAAQATVAELGSIGLVQFRDVKPVIILLYCIVLFCSSFFFVS